MDQKKANMIINGAINNVTVPQLPQNSPEKYKSDDAMFINPGLQAQIQNSVQQTPYRNWEEYAAQNPLFNHSGSLMRVVQVYKNGCTYQGELVKATNRREGLGTLTRADGSYYFGYWKDGKRHGRGKEVTSQLTEFEGMYMDDFKNGYGEESNPNGYCYKGFFVSGKKNGHGHQVYPSGDQYNGYWIDGHHEGEGVMMYADGGMYQG